MREGEYASFLMTHVCSLRVGLQALESSGSYFLGITLSSEAHVGGHEGRPAQWISDYRTITGVEGVPSYLGNEWSTPSHA